MRPLRTLTELDNYMQALRNKALAGLVRATALFQYARANPRTAAEPPLRSELFSIELLQQHARALAQSHRVTVGSGHNPLLARLKSNEQCLREYNRQTLRADKIRGITPAAEWLLDNFYLIEQQIRMARRHLPRQFNRELPCLTCAPQGVTRVYQLALELISHVDAHLDASHLTSFIAAYQEATPLLLGELWAVPIMLRLALIENLRRVAAQLNIAREERDLADEWADRMLKTVETDPSELVIVVGELAKSRVELTQAFVTEFWRRVQGTSTSVKLALNWLEDQVAARGTTIAQLVQSESQDQATQQVSVGNCITSLRFLDAMDWREFVESLSAVEGILRTDPAGVYSRMDFATRDAYRHSVEEIAKKSKKTESAIATEAVNMAFRARNHAEKRRSHVGYYLYGRGLDDFKKSAGLHLPALSTLPRRRPLLCFLGSIAFITLTVTAAFVGLGLATEAPVWALCAAGVVALVCGSQLAVGLVNWAATHLIRPRLLPRLDYSQGIARDHSVMVVVPTMLATAHGVEDLLEGIEVRYLANRDPNACFALLTDFPDANAETLPTDEALVRLAREGIESLNHKYRGEQGGMFYLFHRPRLWNAQAKVWMGYERKRGKLSDLNMLLRGKGREKFSVIAGDLSRLPAIRYVITLDTDTQLPRDAARQLVGTMAHPLNEPILDPVHNRVVDGYSILQPRVAVSLPSASKSRYARLFSGEPGIDPYTRAVSDVYQDVFQEGSFIGKGIYDVDAFEKALGNRFPENRILSHDLLESSYARSALVTDVTLFEDSPSLHLTDARRRHRWMRGDWQIARWLFARVPGADASAVPNPIDALARWKILDNLRRSLVPAALIALFVLGWLRFPDVAGSWTLLVLGLLFAPSLLSIAMDALKRNGESSRFSWGRGILRSASRPLGQCFYSLALLPHEAWLGLDAMCRTLLRLFFRKHKLLEWQTASETERSSRGSLLAHWVVMDIAPAFAAGLLIAVFMLNRAALPLVLPFALLWAGSPLIAWWVSRPIEHRVEKLSREQTRFARLMARKTWRFFETFIGPEDNWLPPDNFQEYPRPIIATRTSPTNIGMGLLSTLAAWDFGYLTLPQLSERLASSLRTMDRLEKYQGHYYNWYDTRTLQVLQPPYLSTVDNGNLASTLLTLRTGLLELADNPMPAPAMFSGLRDTLAGLKDFCQETHSANGKALLQRIDEFDVRLTGTPETLPAAMALLKATEEFLNGLPPRLSVDDDEEYRWWQQACLKLCRDHHDSLLAAYPWIKLPASSNWQAETQKLREHGLDDLWARLSAFPSRRQIETTLAYLPPADKDAGENKFLADLKAALREALGKAQERSRLLEALAARCDDNAMMDFSLLYVPSRKLFSIGYNVATHKLDPSYYDLLASESRLASYVAIALGQVPQAHWFALGRLLAGVNGHDALVSWSGSMFEYLMPQLVMPSYEGTLLDTSARAAVECQIEYAEQLGIPWGISESGYNLTDAQSNYQYRAFGVPGLGLKRGLGEDVVVAPYASAMSLAVAPRAACLNLEKLRQMGAQGRYGFYEALDFTVSRLPRGKSFALVQSYMVHHQSMAFLAMAQCLLDQPMQRRFLQNPFFKAAEVLLHERVPRHGAGLQVQELDTERAHEAVEPGETPFRVFSTPNTTNPEVHLLSNGRYHVMVTNAGGGYSLWNNVALTRWREDATRDCWGTFIYLRDRASSKYWSTAYQPVLRAASSYEAIFSQGRAEFRQRMEELDVHTEIAVSPEEDVEVRRVIITNHSSEERLIELTSFAEVVLNSAAADQAHPAFTKLFVQTEILRDKSAIICSRRPRTHTEQPPWMFQLMLVLSPEEGTASFETDRARFIGRGRDASAPLAMEEDGTLSDSSGSVLDPAVAIRRTVRIGAKETARAVLIMGAAPTRDAVIHLIDRYQDYLIAERGFELAWTHGLVTLRHLNATEPQAQLFGRLASALLFSQRQRRGAQNLLMQNRRGQRNLWSFGISGDLPIVLVRSTSAERLDFIREILQAHAYWRLKGLAADLVIVNDDESSYRQSMHDQIMTLIASGIEAQMLDKPGGIFVRRADQLSPEDHLLLQAAARMVFTDENGSLAEQMQRRERLLPVPPPLAPERPRRALQSPTAPAPRQLAFENGWGGFSENGHEYIITVHAGNPTPAPWANVIANPEFGTLISESGGAYTWSENCHEFRLTPWNNDPVTGLQGEAFYIRDELTGHSWSPTPWPQRGATPYVCRHGFGYSVFEHEEDGIVSELWVYVAADAPVKFARLILRNKSARRRYLTATGYWEWVLGELQQRSAMHVVTELDASTGAVLARNAYNTDFERRVVFAAASEPLMSFTCDRTEFIGRNGSPANPAGLGRQRLSGRVGAGLDPCTALQVNIELNPEEEREVIFKCGAAKDEEKARVLLKNYRHADSCRDAIYMVRALWNDVVGAVQVETPDPALNFLANGWLIYQTLSARIWARTGFYQSGGAFGFRDQLQDTMALIHSRPAILREHLLRAAAHQFREGDVQHWWHPPHDRGVRTQFSDDFLWLPYATSRYVEALGDTGVLDEKIAFLEGRLLKPDEESYYDAPRRSDERGTLYEHCLRAIRRGLRFGRHGLPLMGCGDWNDGMNLVGQHGQGESVWLAFFLWDVLHHFAPVARRRGDQDFADLCEAQASELRKNIEAHAWDGHWYRRAYFDNGEPLGSASNSECQIDSLPQSWSVLTGMHDPERSREGMRAVYEKLVRRDAHLIQLLTPPFDRSSLEPGYIKGYVPGVRENGGQYTHGAIWTVMAFAQMGETKRAWELFDLINPIRHSQTTQAAQRYKLEPYVVAADVYSMPPHVGRGGWSWYTGSAGWLYRLITETLLGLVLEVDRLRFEPRVRNDWKTFQINYRYRETQYQITLSSPLGIWTGPYKVELDGQMLPEQWLPLQDDHAKHKVRVIFGSVSQG